MSSTPPGPGSDRRIGIRIREVNSAETERMILDARNRLTPESPGGTPEGSRGWTEPREGNPRIHSRQQEAPRRGARSVTIIGHRSAPDPPLFIAAGVRAENTIASSSNSTSRRESRYSASFHLCSYPPDRVASTAATWIRLEGDPIHKEIRATGTPESWNLHRDTDPAARDFVGFVPQFGRRLVRYRDPLFRIEDDFPGPGDLDFRVRLFHRARDELR